MREILFRGKRKDNGEWIYGYLVKCEYGLCIATDESLYHIDGAEWNFDCVVVIPESVGQFTGLLDKQEKKIFEGDIIKSGDDVMVVSWNNKFASFCLDKDGWAFSHWFGESCNPQNVEVIGNIHDTPK